MNRGSQFTDLRRTTIMDILDLHPNSPTRQPSAAAVDWEQGMVQFEVDGTESKGEPDTYTILGTYYWAVINGKIHVGEINARAIDLDRQPDTVEEHIRDHLQFTVFNERIEFL